MTQQTIEREKNFQRKQKRIEEKTQLRPLFVVFECRDAESLCLLKWRDFLLRSHAWESQTLRRYDLVPRPTWAINALFHTITMCHWNVVISVHFWCRTIVQNVFKFFSSFFGAAQLFFISTRRSVGRRSLNLSPIVRVMLIFTAHEKHVSTFSTKSHHRYERGESAMSTSHNGQKNEHLWRWSDASLISWKHQNAHVKRFNTIKKTKKTTQRES